MADKWMYIPYDDTQNYFFTLKVPKVVKPTNKKMLL